MNIDAVLPGWSDAERAALDRWRQGHIVLAPKTPWVGASVQPDGTPGRATGELGPSDVRVLVDPGADKSVPYVAIISQTCDVVGTGPGARHPFVQVAPIRDVSEWPPDRFDQLRRGELNDYVFLSAPPNPNDRWAIDLRMSWPLSKDVLVSRSPIEAFGSYEDERQIGIQLALKYRRPALPDILSKTLPDEVRSAIKSGQKTSDWADDILQVRLQIMRGSELEPTEVRIVVVSEAPLDPAQKRPLKSLWNGFKKRLRAHDIEWTSASFRSLDKLSARVYRDSILMNIPELHSGAANRR